MEYKGQLKDFPREVVEKMVEHQVAQGNSMDIWAFENFVSIDQRRGGFTWCDTPEGHKFWWKVIHNMDFELFFEKYPKLIYPRVMLVSDYNEIETAIPQVVFMKKLGYYFAWRKAKTIEEAENILKFRRWNFAWELPKEEPVTEITADEAMKIVAEAKGINIEKLRIKK